LMNDKEPKLNGSSMMNFGLIRRGRNTICYYI
jgi:hypothetical protein